MIIVKLHGGLGNQMFQYALGRNLSSLHGVAFKIDSSYLQKENQSGRSLRVDGFKTELQEAAPAEIYAYRSPLQKFLDRFRPASKRRSVVERDVRFHPENLKRADGYFIGHWNDENYFKSSEKIIREEFVLKNPFSAGAQAMAVQISSKPEPVSIHVRRGDYVSIPKISAVHRALPMSYYLEAMKKIVGRKPNAHFFVSSDDIGWAKENFPKNYPVTFISSPGVPDYEELILMSMCKHNIIANSTFSWWAAWLNTNPQKIIIAPKRWFNNPNRGTGNLIPSSWLTL